MIGDIGTRTHILVADIETEIEAGTGIQTRTMTETGTEIEMPV